MLTRSAFHSQRILGCGRPNAGPGHAAAATVALATLLSMPVLAADWWIDAAAAGFEDGSPASPFNTIQEGLDAATDGDRIRIIAGTYSGAGNTNLDFAGKAIVVRSEDGPTATLIDGGGSNRAFIFDDAEPAEAIVHGLAMINCASFVSGSDDGRGAAMRIEGASPTIRECEFALNIAERGGGALYLLNSSSRIVDSRFILNESAGGWGGACRTDAANLVFRNCVFIENHASYGGALYLEATQAAIDSSQFLDNSADFSGGAAVFTSASSIEVSASAFDSNRAETDGGALRLRDSLLEVRQSQFLGNDADERGGAIFAFESAGAALIDCTLERNTAGAGGGGIQLLDSSALQVTGGSMLSNHGNAGTGGAIAAGDGSPVALTGVAFEENFSFEDGGAVFGNASPIIIRDCTFDENTSNARGGAIACTEATLELRNSALSRNQAFVEGGALFTEFAPATILKSEFISNATIDAGGGITCRTSGPTLIELCRFDSNSATRGGGVHNLNCDLDVMESEFLNNTGAGGGVCNTAADGLAARVHIGRCEFLGNHTTDEGGAILNQGAAGANVDVWVHNSLFIENTAVDAGGAISSREFTFGDIANCGFSRNSVTYAGGGGSGGAISVQSAPMRMANCSLSRNHADAHGGGVRADLAAVVDIDNCILWENDDVLGILFESQVWLQPGSGSTVTLDYSDVMNLPTPPPTGVGPGVLSVDPLFVDAAADDLRLQTTSPCIDAGDNGAVPPDSLDLDGNGDFGEAVPLDLDDRDRFFDSPMPDTGIGAPPIVDMGAFEQHESPPPCLIGDSNCDGSVDFGDIDCFVAALISEEAWLACGSGCEPGLYVCVNDANGDDDVSFDDVDAFVACIVEGSCE